MCWLKGDPSAVEFNRKYMYFYHGLLVAFLSKDKEQVRIVQGEDDSQENVVVNSGDPVELIVALLRKLGGAASVNQLCQVKDTVPAW